MAGNNSATSSQKAAVSDMITKMMKPKDKPTNMSFTMGWDVIASYSEAQINNLLAERHGKEGNGLLQRLEADKEITNPRDGSTYTGHYRVNFGPPLLRFDSTATSYPMCSIQMQIVSGTIQYENDPASDLDPGWSMQLNNIPLASARGELSAAGTIQGTPPMIPGTEPVYFDVDQEQTQHVVLCFDLADTKLVVTVIPPPGNQPASGLRAAQNKDFKDTFMEYFKGKSLSYSIASVNNKRNGSAVELRPEKFQFASYFGEAGDKDVQLLSIFVQVAGGPKTGQTQALQEGWKTKWFNNDTFPIPRGFSASLILSSAMFGKVILKQGFEKSGWTVEDEAPTDDAFNMIVCKSSEKWAVPEQNHEFSKFGMGMQIFNMHGFTLDTKDFPMKLTIKQEDMYASPNMYAYWDITQKVTWEAKGKHSGNKWKSGDVNTHYRLCDAHDFDKPRKLDSEIVIDDENFTLDLKLKTEDFRMDQSEGNEIDFETWEKGMKGLWTKAPKVSISAFGIGFLRTTNLLMPGQRVIDINEGIGLRAPKDLVLVGDVVKG